MIFMIQVLGKIKIICMASGVASHAKKNNIWHDTGVIEKNAEKN